MGDTGAVGTRTLILMRHAKSDWSVPIDDRGRPLSGRGTRQASEAGRWLADYVGQIDLVVLSPAARAADAWERAAAELPHPPPVRLEERAYTFDGAALLALVRALGQESTVVLVGHNPACEELVKLLTGYGVQMKTSALAVIELADWGAPRGRVIAHGRPPSGSVQSVGDP